MVIKNKGQNTAQLDSVNITTFVSLKDCIEVSFEDDSGNIFNKPGEYEYKGVDIVSREIQEDGYKACSNISRVTVEGVRILFLLDGLEAKQDDLAIILDIDVLVIGEDQLEKIDRLAMLYNPKKIIILMNTLKEPAIEDQIKKSFSTASITTERQVKTKQDEYGVESAVVSFTILKK